MGSIVAQPKAEQKRSGGFARAPDVSQLKPSCGATSGMPRFLQRGCDLESCGSAVQFKLVIGAPGDQFERQADQVADAALGSGDTKKPIDPTLLPTIAPPSSVIHAADGGSPLDEEVRAKVEPVIGASLGHVRVHGSEADRKVARNLDAKAFTQGSHIWLGPSQSSHDVELMAHEAAHVVQQGAAREKPTIIQRQGDDSRPATPAGPLASLPNDVLKQPPASFVRSSTTALPPASGPGSQDRRDPAEVAPKREQALAEGKPTADVVSGARSQRQRPTEGAKVGTRESPKPDRAARLGQSGMHKAREKAKSKVREISGRKAHRFSGLAEAVSNIALTARPQVQAPRLRAPATDRPQSATAPARERLRSAVTAARALLAGAPAAGLPEAKSSGGRILLNTLGLAAWQGREHIASEATSAIAATQAAADRHATEVQVSEDASIGDVGERFGAARQQLGATIEQQAGAISRQHEAEQASLSGWHAQAKGRADEAVQHRVDGLAAAGAAQGVRIAASGERAAGSARDHLASAASEAQAQPGSNGTEAGAGRGEVAKRLGSDAGGQFEAASGEVGARLQTHASEAATALDGYTEHAVAAVAGHAATLDGQLDQTAEGAATNLSENAQRSVSSLHGGNQEAQAAHHEAEAQIIDSIRGRAGEHRNHIHDAGSEAVAGLGRRARETVATAQRQLVQQAGKLANLPVAEEVAAEVAPALHAQVVGAHAAAAGQAKHSESKLTDALSTAGRDATASLAQAVPAAAAGSAAATRTVAEDAHRIGTTASAALTHSAAVVRAGAETGIANSVAQLDQVTETARTGLDSAGQAAEQSVGQGAGEAERLRDAATTGLQGRIAEGQQRVDGYVASKAPTVQRSVLGAIGGWFADQFKDLWDMLSSPAFWVGLVVTIVLLPVLGPGAFIVGGIAGGVVAGIQQNVRQGRSWYDYRNILRNAAVGALGGALMALGVGAIIAFGLEGAAATLAVMAVSAAVGIIINWVNGDRWDKGLLANLLLAWLFTRLAAKGRSGGATAAATGGKTAACH